MDTLRVIPQDGRTPLMAASFHGHDDIVRMLIEAKTQVNMQEKVCFLYYQGILTTHHHSVMA